MNQTNRNNRTLSNTPANTLPPDATEAALSLILPPAAFAVFQAYLRNSRAACRVPGMSMREALERMGCSCGCGLTTLEEVAALYAEHPPVTTFPFID